MSVYGHPAEIPYKSINNLLITIEIQRHLKHKPQQSNTHPIGIHRNCIEILGNPVALHHIDPYRKPIDVLRKAYKHPLEILY